MFGKRNVDDLSVEELQKALLIKRRQARLQRFEKLSGEGHTANESLVGVEAKQGKDVPGIWVPVSNPPTKGKPEVGTSRAKKVRDMLLLGLEVVSVGGLVAVLIASYFNLRELNDEVAVAQQNLLTQEVTPLPPAPAPVALARLPGGHSSPTAPGGAVPDVPLHLQSWVQPSTSLSASAAAIEIEKQVAGNPTRIVIPKIKVDAPIVQGVSWGDLKKGVGHLPGSARPGQRGNLYLAAHNDIFGEIFRYLNDLKPGDEYFIYSGPQKFRYVVKEKRIIDPTNVEVMAPTTEPVATLQTCYPYLVDTHRLVVISELAD
jgi:sortase A